MAPGVRDLLLGSQVGGRARAIQTIMGVRPIMAGDAVLRDWSARAADFVSLARPLLPPPQYSVTKGGSPALQVREVSQLGP